MTTMPRLSNGYTITNRVHELLTADIRRTTYLITAEKLEADGLITITGRERVKVSRKNKREFVTYEVNKGMGESIRAELRGKR